MKSTFIQLPFLRRDVPCTLFHMLQTAAPGIHHKRALLHIPM
jgi:hypothetical protein